MGIIIGLKKAMVAELITDVVGSAIYGVPQSIVGLQKVDLKPDFQRVEVPGDDRTDEYITTCNGADLAIDFKSLSSAMKSYLVGEQSMSNGIKVSGSPTPLNFAFGYTRTMSNGVVRYVWLLKVNFTPSDESSETLQKGAPKPQYSQINGIAVKRIADDEWKFQIDSDDPAFVALLGANWFTQGTLQLLKSIVTTTYGNPANVIFVATVLPATGVIGTIYVVVSTNKTSYWNGTAWVQNGSLA